ncbi:abortive infection system antitoxin AbiGi family protein [Colwellia psychrerythraea]|uniref:Uncharacterized protein n=1 Tax=Colwellia psychrerythraea TaxID=28229 RepID=A0A099KKV2_COLPS|nr:abortive infection system antitoxin AbiGi family protein [Colwellia psychrerythraea]KGJ90213.1 Protein of unknown function DUF2743 [Colwellia psychrerythraea]
MDSEFLRFLTKKEHLINDLQTGFDLRKHPISFRPPLSKIIPALIPFWKEKNLYPELTEKYDSCGENDFFIWFGNRLNNDQKFNYGISYLTNQVNHAEINMKCFTELRDNQKLHSNHKMYFGSYGIALTHEWMKSNNGDRIIYVGDESEVTSRIARVLAMLNSFGTSQTVINSMFDILAFTEIEGNSHEYEWRIVGNHHYAGGSHGNHPNNIPFTVNDIVAIYVEKEEEKSELIEVLKNKAKNEGVTKIPQIYLADDVYLSDDEQDRIDNILYRRTKT